MNARITAEQVDALIEIIPALERDYPQALAPFVRHLHQLDEELEVQSTDQPYGVRPLSSADLAAGLMTAIRKAMGSDANPDLVERCADRIMAALIRADAPTEERMVRSAAAWR